MFLLFKKWPPISAKPSSAHSVSTVLWLNNLRLTCEAGGDTDLPETQGPGHMDSAAAGAQSLAQVPYTVTATHEPVAGSRMGTNIPWGVLYL